MIYVLYFIVLLICVYTIRHYGFTLNRLFGFQRHPYIDIDTADWPAVTILVAAHNEEKVVANILSALMTVSYPEEKMLVVPVNDRSTDRTREIIDEFVERYPGRIRPFHRTQGKGGKAAALKDAMELVTTEVILIFDADYIPGAGIIKQLVAPFFDPEVGGVMGRVVPLNVGANLLTRLLDLERSGGYQVDQHECASGAAARRDGCGSSAQRAARNRRLERQLAHRRYRSDLPVAAARIQNRVPEPLGVL